MTDPVSTADQVFRRSLELLLAKDIVGWLALCADDIVAEFPFAPKGYPRQLAGKAAVAGYMQDYPELIDLQRITSLETHAIGSSERVVGEWSAEGRVVPTDTPYAMSYVVFVSVRDGLMTHYRDYWNPLGIPSSFSDAKSHQTGAATA
ncbi:nuclear transport factor 2 family protein [Mycolicibacterium mengxianglii]|uniref:nuclear transport factor 2 family protein n=1 Tax=Mycolicibacterium mengxianglii TaxID=2736649 RepID=UPI0018EF2C12|nr:nuclear transport factor 2 family protein [Mycolicibacterium mengxianglii]